MNEGVMSWMGIWKSLIRRKAAAGKKNPGSVLKVVFCQGEDGFIIAECPQLPGCMSQGRTREEAARNIVDAIQSVLIVRMGQFSPEASSTDCCGENYEGEESFRVEGPELIAV
jgi:predicted RNase H-like HicB family nuclease